MNKVLVTGAQGQLGRDLVKYLLGLGVDVVATDVGELDIADLAAVRQALATGGPQAVVNCAAYNDVDRAERDWRAALDINGLGPRNLAIACEEAGIPLMHFSTDFVFAGDKGSPYTIADEPAPLGAYARSKLLGERMVAGLCRRHFVVRLSWVFGDSGEVNFPRKVLGWAKDREVIRVVDDQVSRPAYTPDLVPPLWKLLKSGAFGLYHLANEGICSRFEWASHLVRSAGLGTTVQPARTADFSEAARRPVYSALDLYPLDDMFGTLPHWRDASDRFLAAIGVKK
ncbi:MAG: dTDP-4-dehydrorhamnose reductase [Deltaproteobacteria bacterium]|nr:MAG: dTDP-4-dehydrorhamnose reductase [Deltaproteobacteria bacterium]